MRFIDLDSIRGKPGVDEAIRNAEQAAAAVDKIKDPARRNKAIKSRDARWKAFRDPFSHIVGAKCWYTESTNLGTDDDVDHYRPKGSVAERPDHGGYWWEAFNWKNLRLSCHRANRLRTNPEADRPYGKADHFPLLDESERWMRHQDRCCERPVLLDPTDPDDPRLLTFDMDGRVAISPIYAADSDAHRRVEASREYLHLDWPAFVEARSDLYGRIATKVAEGDEHADHAYAGDVSARTALKSAAKDLIKLTTDRAEYSKAAIAYVRRHGDRKWVREMVLENVIAGA